MIRDNSAALIVSSKERSVAGVSSRLGLEPTSSHEMGEETRNSRRIPPGSAPRFENESRWVFAVDDVDPDDETGFGSVRKLLAALSGKEGAVRELQAEFDVWIQWTGFSDSDSGGFVIPRDVLPGLAALNCTIMANAELQTGA
ncbi:MAG TPA: DUF4279 domain-containing protein [Pseudolysinimonas sp.]|jgi:hypothetical protein|nr:DUF4279 domain-containing protein [Pseudolysinimonas sp.]